MSIPDEKGRSYWQNHLLVLVKDQMLLCGYLLVLAFALVRVLRWLLGGRIRYLARLDNPYDFS